MSSKNTAVYGIYATPGIAETAVDFLIQRGFTNSAISVLLPDNESTRAFAHEKATKAPEGTTTGAATGGVLGGTLGLLAGIGALAIPGVGPFIAAGPIMATLAGAGVGGAVGGLVGALVGMGIPEYEAKRYEGAVKDGGVLLSIHCDTSDQIDAAKRALKETGASDISSAGEASSSAKAAGRDVPLSTEAPMASKAGARTTYGDLSGTDTAPDRPLEQDRIAGTIPRTPR
ncbi:DUF3341 domain-containing protein [Edaphobacter aggregans]|uniref:DUF3341 domain-containing protein n=1 Tax=Edaphobacter aggregans TaxID=570835 RepID=UPI000AD86F95|nr:DUF3341 domain-containing protein [Edaphobacter aggregans]